MSGPLRVMIVDDEPLAREGLRLRLRGEPGVVIVSEHGDPARALQAMAQDAPDLLFLDVQMPGMDGFGLLEHARDLPLVVFVTAHEEHAIRAFAVRALDYLLKPVDPERLRETLARARAQVEQRRKGELLDTVQGLVAGSGEPGVRSAPPARNGDRIAIRGGDDIQFVELRDIDYVEAAGDAVRLHAGPVTHVVNRSMGAMLAALDPASFVRIHRSTIVNMQRVKSLQPWFHGEYVLVLHDGTRLKLSRGYRSAVERLLGV
ncbi:MAG: yehT 1 [Gemmatimonadetes bacterium]|nr:yehT 1 [Gemmatimonadota bacterium]